MASSFWPEMAAGRPPTRPRRRAGGQPHHDPLACQGTLILGERAEHMKQQLADALVVSMPSVSERKATWFSFSAFTMDSKCGSDRPSLSSFQTMSTSFGRTNASAFTNSGEPKLVNEHGSVDCERETALLQDHVGDPGERYHNLPRRSFSRLRLNFRRPSPCFRRLRYLCLHHLRSDNSPASNPFLRMVAELGDDACASLKRID
jgi:hypothetical protein